MNRQTHSVDMRIDLKCKNCHSIMPSDYFYTLVCNYNSVEPLIGKLRSYSEQLGLVFCEPDITFKPEKC